MTECDTCQTWYHRKCENIPRDVFNKFEVSVKWHCSLTDDYDFKIILAEL